MSDWQTRQGRLYLQDTPVATIAEQSGTPLYVYDGTIIQDRVNRIQQAFPIFNILYSVKANANLAVAALIRQQGIGVEVASEGELETAFQAGFTPDQMSFAGPGKSHAELARAVDSGIDLISVESSAELARLTKLAQTAGRKVSVLARVNIAEHALQAQEKMGGRPSQFGIDVEHVIEVLRQHKSEWITYRGIHVYAGSQILSSDALIKHFSAIYSLAIHIAHQVGFELACVNFGGGFGIPYHTQEQHLDIAEAGRQICHKLQHSGIELFLELGRYFVAESGIFLTRVEYVKQSKGINYVITNGGINAFARSAMPWANTHRCESVTGRDQTPTDHYTVTGPLCLPADILAESVPLAHPVPGDILVIRDVGAYGYSMSPQLFLSHTAPAEVLYWNQSCHVIREPHNIQTVLAGQHIPAGLL